MGSFEEFKGSRAEYEMQESGKKIMKEAQEKAKTEVVTSREKIELTAKVLSDIACSGWSNKSISHGDESYILIENEITSSDPEDGGADHTVIFKRESDDKYFKFYYSDWDMNYNFDRDFPSSATEVFPKVITRMIFE